MSQTSRSAVRPLRRLVAFLCLMAAATVLALVAAPAQAQASVTPVAAVAADPSPSPTLGANSPNANPPGDNDGDANDYGGAFWILPAALLLALIGGGVVIARKRVQRNS